jgi:hypothetical protein
VSGEGVNLEGHDASGPGAPGRLSGGAAWRAHLTLTIGLALCGAAFWFEIGRAVRGNALSWAYVFEWPLLAIFAVYMWWKVLHPDVTKVATSRAVKPVLAPEFSGMLTAWQDHQRELSASQKVAEDALVEERNRLRE